MASFPASTEKFNIKSSPHLALHINRFHSTAMWSYPISLFGRSNTAFGWKIIKRPVEAPVVSWADHPKRKAAEILLLNDGKLRIFPSCQANGFICFFISAPALFCYFYELTNKIKHIGKYFIVLITSNWPP